MSTGSVTVRLNLNSAGYSAEMAKAQRSMRQLQMATGEMGQHTVSQMQAASASIRVLEGGMTGNIRAAERFISMLPGVGAALQAAFPVVGAIALLGVLVKVGEEVAKFISKLNEIPENPFSGMIASAKLSNDALAITNDRLANEIAKLEHKPQNRMAEALDQMRQASDKLFESLDKSNAAFDEAAGKGGVGKTKGMWQNVTPTAGADAAIKQARAGVQAVTADHQSTIDDALASGDPANIKQAREALMVDLQKAYGVQDAALRAGLDKAQAAAKDFHGSYSVGSDPRAVVQRYQSALTVSAQDQQSVGGQYGNSLMTGEKDSDQDKADQGELAKEAARKRLQGMEEELLQRKSEYGMSIAEERSYWDQREAAFTAGSDAYRQVVEKVANLEIQMQRQQAESLKAARSQQASGSRDSERVLESSATAVAALMRKEGEDVLHTGDRWRAYNDAVAKASEIQAANAAAFDKTRIALELANGQISKLDAAEQMAGVHTREFTHDLETLQAQRKQIEDDGDLTDVQRTTALKNNSNAQTELQGKYQTQQMGDQSSIADQQLGPATARALGTMVNEWSNMTSSIVQTMTKAIDGFNDQIVNAILGKKTNFGKVFSDAGAGLTKSALKSTEGKVMGAFGLGKADGSKDNPIWTRDAGSAPIPGSAGAQGSQGGGKSGGGSIWGNLLHAFLPSLVKGIGGSGGGDDGGGGGGDADDGDFQGGFASGGNFVANRPMLVGERGPELLTPSTAGRITPNRQLGGSGDSHTHINVDARGSSDPAAIHAAVMRAAPQIVAASLQAHHQRSRRMGAGR